MARPLKGARPRQSPQTEESRKGYNDVNKEDEGRCKSFYEQSTIHGYPPDLNTRVVPGI